MPKDIPRFCGVFRRDGLERFLVFLKRDAQLAGKRQRRLAKQRHPLAYPFVDRQQILVARDLDDGGMEIDVCPVVGLDVIGLDMESHLLHPFIQTRPLFLAEQRGGPLAGKRVERRTDIVQFVDLLGFDVTHEHPPVGADFQDAVACQKPERLPDGRPAYPQQALLSCFH